MGYAVLHSMHHQAQARCGNAPAICCVFFVRRGTQKTKPTQHTVKSLLSLGLQPDLIICRCEEPIQDATRCVMWHVLRCHVTHFSSILWCLLFGKVLTWLHTSFAPLRLCHTLCGTVFSVLCSLNCAKVGFVGHFFRHLLLCPFSVQIYPLRMKISQQCGVPAQAVLSVHTVPNLYNVPLMLAEGAFSMHWP